MSINNKEVTLYKNKVEKSIGTAIFSLDHKYRYVLTRKWSNNGICLFIMLNPSTADAYKFDPTVSRAYKIAKARLKPIPANHRCCQESYRKAPKV